MRRHLAFVGLGLYSLAAVRAFAWLWADDSNHDYAGWVPVTAALAVPTVLAILADPARSRHLHASAVAIPASLAIGCAALGMLLWVMSWFTLSSSNSLSILVALILAGPVTVVTFAVVVWRYLLHVPLRDRVAHVLKPVAGASVVVLVLLAPTWWDLRRGGDQSFAALALVLGGLPLAWVSASALAFVAGPRDAA